MADPTFIDTPSGDQLVILTRADYDDLTTRLATYEEGEDDADAAAASQRLANWQAAGRPAFPLPVVRLIRGGASPLRAFRKHRGMTRQALAAAVRIGPDQLGDLEAGRTALSPELLALLAAALAVAAASLEPL